MTRLLNLPREKKKIVRKRMFRRGVGSSVRALLCIYAFYLYATVTSLINHNESSAHKSFNTPIMIEMFRGGGRGEPLSREFAGTIYFSDPGYKEKRAR